MVHFLKFVRKIKVPYHITLSYHCNSYPKKTHTQYRSYSATGTHLDTTCMLSHVHYIILFLITSPTTAIINTTVDIGHHLTTKVDKSQNERLHFFFFMAIFNRQLECCIKYPPIGQGHGFIVPHGLAQHRFILLLKHKLLHFWK